MEYFLSSLSLINSLCNSTRQGGEKQRFPPLNSADHFAALIFVRSSSSTFLCVPDRKLSGGFLSTVFGGGGGIKSAFIHLLPVKVFLFLSGPYVFFSFFPLLFTGGQHRAEGEKAQHCPGHQEAGECAEIACEIRGEYPIVPILINSSSFFFAL